VKLATMKKDGSKWAIKVIKKQSLSAEDDKQLQSEVQVLETVHHENIVKLNETFDTTQNLYMVMEVCAGGELFDRIVEKDHYSEEQARDALKQIATALHYCHTHEEGPIVHRDLKPENLLYSDHTEEATLK
jgi:calcium/calmodulin-dependent protein kinase I